MENYDDLFAPQPDQRRDAPFDKDAWAARKQQEREGVYAMIDSHVHDMGVDGGVFQAYLDVQARFDLYSVSNAILVAAQKPDATKLADFDTWKSSGLYVKRGAEAITILEPGKEYTREQDGSKGVFYDPKKMFDISQTNSTQRAAPPVARDGRLLLKALMNNALLQQGKHHPGTARAERPYHLPGVGPGVGPRPHEQGQLPMPEPGFCGVQRVLYAVQAQRRVGGGLFL